MRSLAILLLGATVLTPGVAGAQGKVTETVGFPAEDGVRVVADLYLRHADPHTPFVVLLHQGRSSKGEYRDIAPRLSRMGFNCMAVDLRSGAKANKVENLTSAYARSNDMPRSYVAALMDVRAAVEYARKEHAQGELILLGSTYSASLALILAGERPDLVDGVVAFGPTECFGALGRSETWVEDSVAAITCPVFITSAQGDSGEWQAIFAALPSETRVSFMPQEGGRSNARALSKTYKDQGVYWKALRGFLDEHYPRPSKSQSAGAAPASDG